MRNYSVYCDSEINIFIQEKLDFIKNSIISLIGKKNVLAIVLTGGFGRGEGGVIKNKDTYHLVNDLDINILIRPLKYRRVNKLYNRKIKDLAQELAEKIEIKQIDLGISHPARFYFSTNKVGSYEYRCGHKILYGKIDVTKRMKNYKAEKLPITDGTQFLLTRGSGMLISALYFQKNRRINKEDRENFLVEANKAILAMGDSNLLLKKKYHYSYLERLKRLNNISFSLVPKGDVIKKMYQDALQWKLTPNLNWRGDEKEIESWFHIKDLFSEFFLWFENRRLNQEFESWKEYIQNIYEIQGEFGLHIIKKLSKTIFSKNKIKNFPAKLSIMPGFLFSITNHNPIDKNLFELSKQNMKNHYNIESDTNNWSQLVKQYLGIFHSGGIVRKLSRDE